MVAKLKITMIVGFAVGFVTVGSLWIIGGEQMRIERKVKLAASQERVWHLLTDEESLKAWNPDIVEIRPLSPKESPPLPEVGERSIMIIKEGSGTAEYESEIIESIPNRKLSISLHGGSLGVNPMIVNYELETHDGATGLTYSSKWQPSGFFLRVLTPLISIMARKNIDLSMERLRKLSAGKELAGTPLQCESKQIL